MEKLTANKSILARLLATENINVEHRSVPTAYFDLKSRTLVCPILKDMDGAMYDLFMGHEVGHATETPAEGWHNAITENANKSFKTFLNVIEDARIERKVKRRYPGLAKSFALAYKELYNRDFFGIKNLPDLNKLNLIDRINIRFKLNSEVVVTFNDVERGFVREIENADTWEQVEDIAKRVFEYSKENEQDKIQSLTDLEQEMDSQSSGEDDGEESEDDSDTDGDDTDDVGEGEDEESNDGEEESKGISSDSPSSESEESPQPVEETDEPSSVTDRIFRNRENELINESGIVNFYELPNANLKAIIVENHLITERFEMGIGNEIRSPYNVYGRAGFSYDFVANKSLRIFNKNNKKFISHILKEFEMRKMATQYARTQTARTGELDMNVLHKYKFTNDIFKKINVVGKGKSHGMILFLDMSGSMAGIFRNTVEQLLVLSSFCKLANIPFDVYGFCDQSYPGYREDMPVENGTTFAANENDIQVHGHAFHLKHLLGSSLSATQYRKSFNMLAIIANEYNRGGWSDAKADHGSLREWDKAGITLGNTPLGQTLLASRQIISDFKSTHKIDIMNVMYLTDGEGSGGIHLPNNKYSDPYSRKAVNYLIDKKTKKRVQLRNSWHMETELAELVREVSGCKHIGFYLTSKRNLTRTIYGLAASAKERDAIKKSLKVNNFFQHSACGYDKYFYMVSSESNIKDADLWIDNKMTNSKIASIFKKSQEGKKSNRVLVSQFTQEIATHL